MQFKPSQEVADGARMMRNVAFGCPLTAELVSELENDGNRIDPWSRHERLVVKH